MFCEDAAMRGVSRAAPSRACAVRRSGPTERTKRAELTAYLALESVCPAAVCAGRGSDVEEHKIRRASFLRSTWPWGRRASVYTRPGGVGRLVSDRNGYASSSADHRQLLVEFALAKEGHLDVFCRCLIGSPGNAGWQRHGARPPPHQNPVSCSFGRPGNVA